jgi:2-polyprenyl-6-methoxyphenol hydroxylase-like FAD-dependent oxidoreductase
MKTLASLRVLVVGGGFAGMSAAIELRKFGAEIVLCESDPGRSLAATPAMTMAAAALGVQVGGTWVKFLGFGGIPLAAAALAAFAVLCFSRLPSAGALHSRKEIFE